MDARRRRLLGVSAGVLVAAAGGLGLAARGEEKVIRVVARKFTFTPNVIALKAGEPVVLELTTLDVFMGFNAPDLKVRTDIVPGRTMRVGIKPERAGTYPFLCDVFCGDGHETMSGTIVVT
jgi:cytochrome c oxidase subunit 2